MSSNPSLSAASDERKARLAKLKSLKRKQPEDDVPAPLEVEEPSAVEVPEQDVARLHLSGRNYDPETKGPKLGFENAPTQNMEGPSLEEQAADLEEETMRQAAVDAQDDKGIDIFKLQPKKPNWDLKRELNKKLEVLNMRTDHAIAKLVRERLAAKKAESEKNGGGSLEDGGAAGLEGAAIVEGIRLREREEEEEERREREEEALGML
ncbi:hypothetical protein GQ53DRAFT_745410 [Thozetella sp. PMI_491]|nr:hypothetical protein GQ53DRAFT_745410 [Thozetella sp. PMI_491]